MTQRIGTGGHRLRLQGGERPLLGHLAADDAGQVGLDPQMVHRLQTPITHLQAELTAVTALTQPDASGVFALHRDPGGTNHARGAQFRGLHHQLPPAAKHPHPRQQPRARTQALDLKTLATISAQGQHRPFCHQHTHLRLPHRQLRCRCRAALQHKHCGTNRSNQAEREEPGHTVTQGQPSVPLLNPRSQGAACQI